MSFDSIYEDRFHRSFDELLEVIREQDEDMNTINLAHRELFEKYEYAIDEVERLTEENSSLRQRIAELEANQQLNNI